MADKKQGKTAGSNPGASSPKPPRSPAADRDPPAVSGGPQAPDPDAARNAADQRAAQQAGALREAVFPSFMASALGLDNLFESRTYKAYLERLIEDAGNPTDPIERMLLEQLALAHFRIGQLHVSAGSARGLEAVKVYNSVAARMLGEFRRTALALRVVQAGVPKGEAAKKVKLLKLAQ